MCEICDFYKAVGFLEKSDPAIDSAGVRTIHGYYNDMDAAVLAQHYPRTGMETIKTIAGLIHYPRLLEVAGLVEMVERYLEGSFSTIRGVAIQLASNPLSILFWSPRSADQTVHRVKTTETELLHGAMEKMALRRGSLDAINAYLTGTHGIALTYGCSCCVIAVGAGDLPALYESEYYKTREGLGRFFDSDVLTASKTLFGGVSVAQVPQRILDLSADFGQAEVRSYQRFAGAVNSVIGQNPVTPDFSQLLAQAKYFLTGT